MQDGVRPFEVKGLQFYSSPDAKQDLNKILNTSKTKVETWMQVDGPVVGTVSDKNFDVKIPHL